MTPAVLLLLVALQAQDPVQVRARLVDEEIQAGQTTVLRVDVETEGGRAQIDRFRSLPPGLALEGTRDFDQRQFSLPGGARRFISREFVLRARAPGRYRIPSLNVIVAGQTYSTRSLFLDVTASPIGDRNAPGAEAEDGVVLRAWLDTDTVYTGEQVTFHAEAMFSQDARFRLRRAPEYEPPTPSGFWVHELPDPERGTTRREGGQTYEVQRFQRGFFPMSPGRYEIPPARLQYEVRRGLLYAPQTKEKTTDPIPLVVLPVPDNAPSGFTGAVGSYRIRGHVQPERVPAGEAVVLSVDVEGLGNVKTLPPPALPDMPGIDVYPPSEDAELELTHGQIGGVKRFSWVLIPREPGQIELPELRYPYFDPELERFETATLASLSLEVTPGTGEGGVRRPTLRYIAPEPDAGDPLSWVRSPGFAAAQALPLLLLLTMALGLPGTGRGEKTPSLRALRRRRTARLQEMAARAGEGGPALFADAEEFARGWLADRLGIPLRQAAHPDALVSAGVSPETASSVRTILYRISSARYAPVTPGPEARRDILRALDHTLQRVDREAGSRRRERRPERGAATVLLVAALALSLAAGASAQSPATPHAPHAPQEPQEPGVAAGSGESGARGFQAGVSAFDEERYLAAAEAFREHVRQRPGDPAGWYNLGTAYYHAGHPGFAVWAWLNVPRLDPRNDDVRHNLRIAGVPPELVRRVSPPFPLRGSELFLLAAIAWWTAGIAGALWLRRRRKRAAITVGVALVMALALAGTAWASTHVPETLIVLRDSTLRTGPTLGAAPVIEVAAGAGLVPIEVRGDWVRARTLQGDEGWLETNETGDI